MNTILKNLHKQAFSKEVMEIEELAQILQQIIPEEYIGKPCQWCYLDKVHKNYWRSIAKKALLIARIVPHEIIIG